MRFVLQSPIALDKVRPLLPILMLSMVHKPLHKQIRVVPAASRSLPLMVVVVTVRDLLSRVSISLAMNGISTVMERQTLVIRSLKYLSPQNQPVILLGLF